MNALIPMGFQMPELRPQQSNANALARVLQVKQAVDQGDMNQMKMDEFRRGIEQENALSKLYAGAIGPDGKIDRTKILTGAAQGNLGSRIPGLQKQFMDIDKGEADIASTRAQAQERMAQTFGKYLDANKQITTRIMANPTPQAASAAMDELELIAGQLGIPPSHAGKLRAQLQALGSDPMAIKQWAAGGAMQADKLLETFSTRNLGGTTDTMGINPVTGVTRVVNSAQNTQSPDSVASVGATLRGQNMLDSRTREEGAVRELGALRRSLRGRSDLLASRELLGSRI